MFSSSRWARSPLSNTWVSDCHVRLPPLDLSGVRRAGYGEGAAPVGQAPSWSQPAPDQIQTSGRVGDYGRRWRLFFRHSVANATRLKRTNPIGSSFISGAGQRED